MAGRPKRLTARRAEFIRSDDSRRAISDPQVPGLQLLVGAKRADGAPAAKTWHLRFTWRGKRARVTLGRFPEVSQADAHEKVREARRLIEAGIDPRRAGFRASRATSAAANNDFAPAPFTVGALAVEFMERFVRPNRKRPEYVQDILDRDILPKWRDRDARTIKPRDVIALLDGIVDRGSPVQANRVAAVMSQMFRFGVHRQIVELSPVQLLFKPGGREKPRDRVLSDAELAALRDNAPTVFKRAPRTAAVVRIALLTACRRGELAAARWTDVHLKGSAPIWRIPPEHSKTGAEAIKPLVPDAVSAFLELRSEAGKSRWVLPNDTGDGPMESRLLTRSVARHLKALKDVGVEAFTLHDLRRTVRTGLARLGIEPHIAERVLDHLQPGIVRAYDVHRYLNEKRAALEKWAAHLNGLTP